MKNHRPQAQIPTLMMGCIIGEEDTREIVFRRKEVDLLSNELVSPTIQDWLKKANYSWFSRGGPGGVPRSSIILLTSRGNSSTRLGGSQM